MARRRTGRRRSSCRSARASAGAPSAPQRWKYSVRAPDKTGQDADSDVYVEDFLYDLEADPHERNNLVESADHAAVRAHLAERLKARIVAAGEAEPTIVPLQ